VGDPYGLRRVVRPKGVLPQQAEQLDPALPMGEDELLIEVEHLNIDAASFRQLESTGREVGEQVMEIVRARGKMHNPVTGSGGMLIGRVASVGPKHPAREELRAGDRIATLVSLTLTPLLLREVRAVRGERIEVRGTAVLFATGLWAPMPDDLPEAVALSVLDVCGAPAWVARIARKWSKVLVIGAGKSGSLASAQARKNGAQVTVADVRPRTSWRTASPTRRWCSTRPRRCKRPRTATTWSSIAPRFPAPRWPASSPPAMAVKFSSSAWRPASPSRRSERKVWGKMCA